MAHRWKLAFFVLFLWHAVVAFGFWMSSGSSFQPDNYTRGLSYMMGFLRLPPTLQTWIYESYTANLILCPPTLVCLAFLAWRKRLSPGHLAKIGLFLVWQIAITLVTLFVFKTGTLLETIGEFVQSFYTGQSWETYFFRMMSTSLLTIFVSTLPVHCAALWYCLFRKRKETTAASDVEFAQPA